MDFHVDTEAWISILCLAGCQVVLERLMRRLSFFHGRNRQRIRVLQNRLCLTGHGKRPEHGVAGFRLLAVRMLTAGCHFTSRTPLYSLVTC